MANNKGTSLEEMLEKYYEDPEFRKADRAIKPRFEIVEQVVERRIELGISQAELAEKADTHQSRISKIESAEFDLRLSTLTKIAEALGCQVCIQLVPFSEGRYQSIQIPIETDSRENTVNIEINVSSIAFAAVE